MKWTHDALAHDFAEYQRSLTDRMVWTDMQIGPAGSPRPDVYTVPKSYSKFLPIAYEVKVSVADFRKDVTAGKYTTYLDYAAGVVFLAPQGLLSRDEIPVGCGLMVRTESGWHKVKGPTLKKVDSLPHAAWMKLLIDGVERLQPQMHVRYADQWTLQESLRAKLGEKVADAFRTHLSAQSSLEHATAELRNAAKTAQLERDKILTVARESAKTEAARANAALAELAVSLGLPATSCSFDVVHKCRELARRLSDDDELQRMRRQFENVRRALDEGMKALPQLPEPKPEEEDLV